jgi:hypothetical protein
MCEDTRIMVSLSSNDAVHHILCAIFMLPGSLLLHSLLNPTLDGARATADAGLGYIRESPEAVRPFSGEEASGFRAECQAASYFDPYPPIRTS